MGIQLSMSLLSRDTLRVMINNNGDSDSDSNKAAKAKQPRVQEKQLASHHQAATSHLSTLAFGALSAEITCRLRTLEPRLCVCICYCYVSENRNNEHTVFVIWPDNRQ